MKRGLLALCVLFIASSAAAERASYALIVTNNRSQSASRPDLHYADDDGVQYARLFGDLLGTDRVTLLTQLDAESSALHPHVHADPPTRANVAAAVARLAQRMAAARAAGERPILYLVFAGHGDLDRGQGYVDLADGRLTASELDERVLARLPAERVHLILDSCNSYFLLNPRKPGGKRWSSAHAPPPELLSKYPGLGAILSTSAEAITYEWSELQSGVFSYEVRAGLRGAADADGDGRITYAELSGFIRVANRPIVNDLYRPKVFSRSPAADTQGANAVLAELPRSGRRLLLDAAGQRRLTLRDPRGTRLLDLHKEAGTALSLSLPAGEMLRLQERVPGEQRPQVIDRELPETGDSSLTALPGRPADWLGRGEPPLFGSLFAEPFGREALARSLAEATTQEAPPSGVTQRDAERLRLHLSLMASEARSRRVDTAAGLLLVGTIPTAALTYSLYLNADRTGNWIDRTGFGTGVVASAVSLGIAVYFLSTPWSEERLHTDFSRESLTTEQARSRAVPRYELELKQKAEEGKRGRTIAAWVEIIGGTINALSGAVMLIEDAVAERSVRIAAPVSLLIGLGQVAFGLHLNSSQSALERTWETYSQDPAVRERHEP